MYRSFVRDAIESAQNYYDYAKTNNTSRNVVNVVEIIKINDNIYRLQLQHKLNHSDYFCIQITSSIISDEWYSKKDEYFISSDLYNILKIDNDQPSIVVEVQHPLSEVFNKIPPNSIKIVSDLKFLIEKVKKWYEDFGKQITLPPHPLVKEDEIFFRGNEQCGKESEEQKKAVLTALSENISYVWGAPGTGKTQFVLADCLLTYIKRGDRVIVLAPTNNAIEQTLISVINTLQQEKESIDCIYRLGIASASFGAKYPKLCDRLDHQAKLESIQNEINILNAQLIKEQDAERVLTNFPAFSEIFSTAEKIHERLLDLSTQKENLELSLKIHQADADDLLSGIELIEKQVSEIDAEEASFLFKFKTVFNKEKHLNNQHKKMQLQIQLEDFKIEYEKLNTTISSIIFELEAIDNEFNKKNKELKETSNVAKNILLQTFGEFHFQTLRQANEHFKGIAAEAKKITIDPSLPEKIKEKEAELAKLKEHRENTFSTKQVFACTVDYLFSHYSYLLENIPYEFAHVFLDEAAYCSFIKSGILYALNAPVTLLGDHMQLTPICEAKKITYESRIFMWAQSAVYFPELFEKNTSLQKIYDRYLSTKSAIEVPEIKCAATATLTQTHRFDNSLALILDHFVYHIGFKGINGKDGDSQTIIHFIHASALPEEKGQRISSEEVRQIKAYLSHYKIKSCAVMTPYKKQRDLLQKELSHLIDRDNILTVHASQGREWDTVILSVVDSGNQNVWFCNSDTPEGLHTLNTAISRVKRNLIIVCDTAYWRSKTNTQLIGALISRSRSKQIMCPPCE